MTIEFNENGVKVEVEEQVVADAAEIGIDVIGEIKAAISDIKEAIVYSKPNCPFCIKAKHILEKRGYHIIERDAVALREQLIEEVTLASGQPPRTVPQIWVNSKYIGGHDQLVAYFAELDKE